MKRILQKVTAGVLALTLMVGIAPAMRVKAEEVLTFTQIATGQNHTLAISANGSVYAWGANSSGQLGVGDYSNRNTPEVVLGLNGKNIAKVTAAGNHSIAITRSGDVYVWGANNHGQLGIPDKINKQTPTLLNFFSGKTIQHITAGQNHTMAVTTDGAVYTWGLNSYGQLGHGDTTSLSEPTRVLALDGKNVIKLAAGSFHSMALTDDGKVYSWGYNNLGRLGHGDTVNRPLPTLVEGLSDKFVRDIAAGHYHSLATSIDNIVYGWGKNDEGQLGTGDNTSKYSPTPVLGELEGKVIKQFATGNNHSFVLTEDRKVYAWGLNTAGQLGLGDTEIRNTPTLISKLSSDNVSLLVSGGSHTLALTEFGGVYSWGYNLTGSLGLGDLENKLVPTVLVTARYIEMDAFDAPLAIYSANSTTEPITVEIIYSADAAEKLYKVVRHENTAQRLFNNVLTGLGVVTAYAETDGWETYTEPIIVKYNSTLYTKEINTDGAHSGVGIYEITNLERIESIGQNEVAPLIPIEGTIHATEISVTHPITLEWNIDPNNIGSEFTALPWDITNNSRIKLDMAITGFELTDASKTLGFSDVLPTLYSDDQWSSLNGADTASKLALGIKRGEIASLWAAELIDSKEFGSIGVAETTTLDFMAKHGLAFTKSQSITHDLTLMFTLN